MLFSFKQVDIFGVNLNKCHDNHKSKTYIHSQKPKTLELYQNTRGEKNHQETSGKIKRNEHRSTI